VTAIQAELDGLPALPSPPRITERTMLDALHRRYGAVKFGARRYAVAEHVPAIPYGAGRIADFIAMDIWRTGGAYELHGHEVKISRSDWLRELADPWKAAEFTPYVHRWWLVVPDAAMVRPGELPEGWGLMDLAGGRLRAATRAPLRQPRPLPPERLAAFLRAVQKTAAGRAAR